MTGKKGKNPKSKPMPQAGKKSADKRSLNRGGNEPTYGSPFNDLDPKRRLGNFNTAGEHSRIGGRTTGIVGQKKQKFTKDQKLKK